MPTQGQSNVKAKRKPNPRPRPLPPAVNARNLALEKKKRGEMNEKFLAMARLVPSLSHAQKLNKVLIVNETVQHLRDQRAMCIAAARDVQGTLDENRLLRAELDALRRETGRPSQSSSLQERLISNSLRELMCVETQPLGTFPAGFGENTHVAGDSVPQLQDPAVTELSTVPESQGFALPPSHDMLNPPWDGAVFDSMMAVSTSSVAFPPQGPTSSSMHETPGVFTHVDEFLQMNDVEFTPFMEDSTHVPGHSLSMPYHGQEHDLQQDATFLAMQGIFNDRL